jgi:hypothetical protein
MDVVGYGLFLIESSYGRQRSEAAEDSCIKSLELKLVTVKTRRKSGGI